MAPLQSRPPHRLRWPLSPSQLEAVDEMFGILFARLGISSASGAAGLTGGFGPPGIEGLAGLDGFPGPPGIAGVAGAAGIQGPPGMDGDDGRDGVPGSPGAAGAAGAAGATGATGAIGPPGTAGDDGMDGWGSVIGSISTTQAIIAASAYLTGAQTLTSDVEAALSFGAADFDTGTLWSAGAPTRLTIIETGYYNISGQITLGTGFAGTAHLRIYKNGVLAATCSAAGVDLTSGSEAHTVSALLQLTAADFVELKVVLSLRVGGTFNVSSGSTASFLQAVKMAPQTSGVAGAAGATGATGPTGIGVPGRDGEDGADVFALLPVPTTVDLLARVITSGSQATIDFPNIPAGYSSLRIEGTALDTQAGTVGVQLRVMINGDATAANYGQAGRIGTQNGATFASPLAASVKGAALGSSPQAGNALMPANVIYTLLDYAGTVNHKRIRFDGDYEDGGGQTIYSAGARWKSASPITQVTIGTDGTAFANGLKFSLYGVR
jgi:hypothetical protein